MGGSFRGQATDAMSAHLIVCLEMGGEDGSTGRRWEQRHGGTQHAMCWHDCTMGLLRRLVGAILLVHSVKSTQAMAYSANFPSATTAYIVS